MRSQPDLQPAWPPLPTHSSALAASANGSAPWRLQWRAGQRKTVYLCAAVLGACALVFLVYLMKIWGAYQRETPGHPAPFGDFLALWSYAEITRTHPVAELYDFALLHARQVALGMARSAENPFPYPPTGAILLWPIGLLPYELAYLAWTIGTLALFVWAIAGLCSRTPLATIGAILAPACIATVDSGQSGFLSAALMIGGIRLAPARPILGGILIGILSFKPQLGLLVPVALVSAGLWRAFGAACATVVGAALAATFAFGWTIWPAWLSMLPNYTNMFDRGTEQLTFMPTILANLRLAGMAAAPATLLQAAVAIIVACLVWGCFRRGSGQLAAAALIVGTFLVTPHAFIYDTPMVVGALALFIDARMRSGGSFTLIEIVILLTATLFPIPMMMANLDWPVSAVPLILLFGLIVRADVRSVASD